MTNTGIYPFIASSSSVAAAKYLFPVLNTFVAPIFPDPIFLKSTFPNIFVNKRPNGIDPLRYENKLTKKISIFNYIFS